MRGEGRREEGGGTGSGWRRLRRRSKGSGRDADGRGLGKVPGVASEETRRGLTEGKMSASREEAGPDGSAVWRGTRERRNEADGRRKPGKARRPAGASSAKLWGNRRRGPLPRGQNPVPNWRP